MFIVYTLVNFLWLILEIYYPDCNFTNGFGGWFNYGNPPWIIVNSTMKDIGRLTGKQGSFPSEC